MQNPSIKKWRIIATKVSSIVQIAVFKLIKLVTKYDSNMPLARNPLCIELPAIDESKMMKFTYEATNMVYLYDPVNRVAFAYHAPDGDDYIPASYGISDWVENMTEKPISMTTLYQQYTIIGL